MPRSVETARHLRVAPDAAVAAKRPLKRSDDGSGDQSFAERLVRAPGAPVRNVGTRIRDAVRLIVSKANHGRLVLIGDDQRADADNYGLANPGRDAALHEGRDERKVPVRIALVDRIIARIGIPVGADPGLGGIPGVGGEELSDLGVVEAGVEMEEARLRIAPASSSAQRDRPNEPRSPI
jgi:hypothetical protein